MGLLDMNEEQTGGLLNFGLNMLANSGRSSTPRGFGEIFGVSAQRTMGQMAAAKKQQIADDYRNEQMKMLKLKQTLDQQKADSQKGLDDFIQSRLLGGPGAPFGGSGLQDTPRLTGLSPASASSGGSLMGGPGMAPGASSSPGGMPAAQMGGEVFYQAASKAGLGTDHGTLNRIVSLVNSGMSPDQAALSIARKEGGNKAGSSAGPAAWAQSGDAPTDGTSEKSAVPDLPQQMPRSQFPFSLNDIAYLKLKGRDLTDVYKLASEPYKLEGGNTYVNRATGQREYITKLDNGLTMSPGGAVSVLPGYSQSNAAIKAAEFAAKEGASADHDLVTVTLPGERPRQMTRSEAVRLTQGGAQQQQGPVPAPGFGPPRQAAPQGQQASPAGFPRISPEQQAGADGERLRLLKAEMPNMTNPADQQALQREIAATEARINSGNPFGASQRGAPGIALQSPAEAAAEKEALEGRAKTGVEREKEKPLGLASVQSSVSGLDRLSAEADAIMKDPALKRITGMNGKFPNMPGSEAANVQARLETLKSQVGFSVLQAMRDASKTGGALGAVSERENQMLQNNLAALDTTQSPEAFQASLKRIVDYAAAAKGRLSSAYKDTYSQDFAPVAGQQPSTRRKYNPATGRIE